MKLSTRLVGTAVVLGVLALFVGTSRAGGITPVPKILTVTADGTLVSTRDDRGSETIFPDPDEPRGTSGRVVRNFKSLALDRRTAMPPGQVGLKVYIADAGAGVGNGKILRIEIVEGDPPYEVAEELLVGLQSPAGIAFDPKTDFVYWSDETEGVIYRANATGATLVNVEVVVSGLSSPKIVRICSATDRVCGNRDKIYWTEPGDSRIGRATLSSLSAAGAATAAGDLVTGLSSPAGLSIGKNKVYWTATDTDEIGRANLGAVNSAVNFTFVDNVIDSPGISLGFQGESAKQMFWTLTDTGRGPGAIQHRNIDGDTGDGTEFTDGNPGSVTDIRVLRPGRAVPTVSTWGVVVLLLLVLAAGTVVFRPLRASPS